MHTTGYYAIVKREAPEAQAAKLIFKTVLNIVRNKIFIAQQCMYISTYTQQQLHNLLVCINIWGVYHIFQSACLWKEGNGSGVWEQRWDLYYNETGEGTHLDW